MPSVAQLSKTVLVAGSQSSLPLWFMTLLGMLLANARLLLRGPPQTTPPLPYKPKPDARIDFAKHSSAFTSKIMGHLSRAVYGEIFPLVKGRISALSLREDRWGKSISVRASSQTNVRTVSNSTFVWGTETQPTNLELNVDLALCHQFQWASLNFRSLKDGTPTLQAANAVLAWLVHFFVQFTPPSSNAEVVLSIPVPRRLVQVSQWLKTAPVLAYAYTVSWKLRFEDSSSFIGDSMAPNLATERPRTIPWEPSAESQPPTQVSRIPDSSALCATYFIPADRSFMGCIEDPKGSPLFRGGYSDVWCSNVRFFAPSDALPREVAVKVLRAVWLNNQTEADANERKLRRLMQEAITWIGLPKHPNIVPLIGWTLIPNLSLISPWYKHGNLYHNLKDLSDIQRIQILLGISKGLECLHSRNIVHGDLKPENILMSDGGEPLLADFGLSTILGEDAMYTPSHRTGGSTPWMSPECILGEPRSCQNDVYSFGSLAFKVMTGESPHAGLTNEQITLKLCGSNNPKDPIEDWSIYPRLSRSIKDLITDCWSRSPNARPSMSAVVGRLTTFIEEPRQLESHTLPCEGTTRKGFN